MQIDPLPEERLLGIKTEIVEEVTALIPQSAQKRGMLASGESQQSKDQEDEENEVKDDDGKASLKNLTSQMEQLREKMISKFEKLRQEFDEKQRVSDAKLKRSIKEGNDKGDKKLKQ